VVAALEFEARSLGNTGDAALISISGIGAAHAERSAHALVAAGADALLSWGVVGALDPTLGCGTAVLPVEVLHQQRRYATSTAWRERLLGALSAHLPAVSGALLSSDVAVPSAALKARLFTATRAVAVDMESAAVAGVAAQHGLPFLALRVILDTATDTLPASIARAFEPQRSGRGDSADAAAVATGRPRLWPLLRAPADWGRLLGLALRYRVARRALEICRRYGDPTRAPAAQAVL